MAGIEVYKDVTFLGLFFFCLWLSGWLCRKIKLTPIVGQILTGILFGPQGVNFVPLLDGFNEINGIYIYCIEENITFPLTEYESLFPERKDLDNFLIVLGNIGVTFLIFESGMHVDFEIVERVGSSAVAVAVFGTLFSYILGVIFALSVGFDIYPDGIAIGAVIAPTSVGIAIKILSDNGQLVSTFGQTIVTAAFTDDIFSLISLALLVEIAGGEVTAFSFFRPIGLTVSIMAVSLFFARLLPGVMTNLSKKFSTNGDSLLFCILLGFLSVFGYIGTFVGSHLLGAFFAGVAFSQVPRTCQVWAHMTEMLTAGLLAIFFGATVAFQIPVDELMNINNFWKGVILGLGSILVKVVSGFHLKHRWEVGWAMVSRGEFSFLVGETLETTEYLDTGEPFLSEEAFGIAVWAVLIAIFVAPVCFEFILQRSIMVEEIATSAVETMKSRSHYLEDGRRPLTKVSTANVIRSLISRSKTKREVQSNIWSIKILFDEPQSGLFQDIVEVVKSLHITVIRFEHNSQGYEFHVELEEPNSSGLDEYMFGDIDKTIERIKKGIQKLLIIDSEILIERIDLPEIVRKRRLEII